MSGPVFETLALGTPAAARSGASELLQALLDVEAALAHARADAGAISPSAASAIAGMCKVGLFDAEAVVADCARQGHLAAELAERLRETVALFDPAAAVEVHRECTDAAVFELAQQVVVRRALAELDERLSRLAGALAAQAAVMPALADAAGLMLDAQRRIRRAGAAALCRPAPSLGEPTASAMQRAAAVLALDSEGHGAAGGPGGVEDDEGSARLACALARTCADAQGVAAVLMQTAPAAGDPSWTSQVARARERVRGMALRAPHRVAAWLACSGLDDGAPAAAEAAALLDMTIAAASVLEEVMLALHSEPPRADAAPAVQQLRDRAGMQRAAAPWQRWLG